MKNLIFLGFLACLAFVGVGMYQGWFAVEKTSDGKSTHFSVQINNEGFAKSKADFLKAAQDRLRDVANEIDKLRTDAPAPAGIRSNSPADPGDAQAMEQLLEKKRVAEKQIEEIKNSTAETFGDVKSRADHTFDDLKTNLKGASERFRRRRSQ